MRVLTGVGLMVIAILLTQDVFAARPQVCTQGFNSASFDQGYSQGKNLISSLFQAIGTDALQRCQREDYFASQVTRNIERLTLPINATDFVRCRHSGLFHGVYAQLWTISNICDFTCAYNGRLIGELSAKFYCDFAITFNGFPLDPNWVPRNPYTTCDFTFATACENIFDVVAGNFIQPGTNLSCKPYISHQVSSPYYLTKDYSCELPAISSLWDDEEEYYEDEY
jgi:hypothetical protein